MCRLTKFFTLIFIALFCSSALAVTIDGISLQFPKDWKNATSNNIITSESPDKSSKFFLMATQKDNFDNVHAQILNPWLNQSFSGIKQVAEDNSEHNGLGLRTLTFDAKRKADKAKVTIIVQFAFVLGDEPPKTVLLINVAANEAQAAVVHTVFENQKADKNKTAGKSDALPAPEKPVKNQTVAENTGNTTCPKVKTPLTNAEINEIIRVHNETRAAVGTPPLKWNCALAGFAQSWANKDVFEHSSDEAREKIIPGISAGENLAADSSPTTSIVEMQQGWVDEGKDWNRKAKKCNAGKNCGHYTAMIWKTTTDIGCGLIRNGNVMGPEWKGQSSYLVCNYSPAGNEMGSAPY